MIHQGHEVHEGMWTTKRHHGQESLKLRFSTPCFEVMMEIGFAEPK